MRIAALGTALLALLPAIAMNPTAWADPADPAVDAAGEVAAPAPPVGPPAAALAAAPLSEIPGNPVSDACKQFGAALNLAASNYEEFAYATAGNGNYVNYGDPTVWRSNVVGRTALREAAATALAASRIPGLVPEVADPMRSWSLHAGKLLVIMGLHGGGDTLNDAATELNAEAASAQTACAMAMKRS
ncbi:MAG: hypothetical protein ACR2JM_03965 [Mycobacterium sp.]